MEKTPDTSAQQPPLDGSPSRTTLPADQISVSEGGSDTTTSQLVSEGEESVSDLDLNTRVLCPDGNCIGVIGPDQRCKECGTLLEPGDASSSASAALAAPNLAASNLAALPPALDSAETGPDEGALDFSSRTLCSDGACIGLVGSDGRCKECGKPYAEDPELQE
jgi:hypothetical protein